VIRCQWTSLSPRKLCKELKGKGREISYPAVGDCLRQLHYSLQANRKSHEGNQHMDRDAQFEYINNKARRFLTDRQLVISVDTKKGLHGIDWAIFDACGPTRQGISRIFCISACLQNLAQVMDGKSIEASAAHLGHVLL
jgi:hypothetical protein